MLIFNFNSYKTTIAGLKLRLFDYNKIECFVQNRKLVWV